MIIDSHLHLDDTVDGTALGGARELDRQLAEADIALGVVLHLVSQPWSSEEVAEAISSYPRLRGFINVDPRVAAPERVLRDGVEKLGYVGLKLHPRIQEIDIEEDSTVELVQAAGEMGVPVLIDAFPDGTHLQQGFAPLKYARLAERCPETQIIWAHMGGHYVIDFMMLAKRLPNVRFDLSYSFLYYEGSSVTGDIVYAMRSMKFDRILYGSDYPDRPILPTLDRSLELLRTHGVSGLELEKIMSGNARELFTWVDAGK